jgi:hypothetical protein
MKPMTEWPFEESPDANVLTLRPILNGAAIQVVERGDDGSRFLDDRPAFSASDLTLAPFRHVLQMDASLREVADLPRGWRALRDGLNRLWRRQTHRNNGLPERNLESLLPELQRPRQSLPDGFLSTRELLREDRAR